MDNTAIWITGIGAVTPVGDTLGEITQNLLAGRSGVRPIDRFDTSRHTCRFAGQCGPLPRPEGWNDAEFETMRPWEQVLCYCASQALNEAGWWNKRPERIGMAIGIGAEWQHVWERDFEQNGRLIHTGDPSYPSVGDRVRKLLNVQGPVATVAAACASSNIALATARRWLRMGWVDVCLAGGLDLPITPMSVGSFANLGALSKRNDAPPSASRPFDRDRDGFVLGEGGVLLVLERADDARRRGAVAHAEVAGFGASSDASHLVIPSSDPSFAADAVRAAMRDAQASIDDVDYVNAHATSTPVGDKFETHVLQSVLGARTPSVPVSSTKSMTGHMLSAAAAFEAIACMIAMKHHAIPPTINLENPDPDCQLCHVPNQAREQQVDVAVNNAFGFGGSNTCLVLRRAA